jgi:homogentisate 1,2-dioxygenase
LPHGPQPKAFRAAASGARSETDEVAVMLDARDALDVAPLPEGVEWQGYGDSWKGATP